MARLHYYLNLYRAFLKASILSNIQYRASGMIWMIGSILEPTIYLIVWSSVAKSQGGEVGGYTASEFAAYYILMMFINHLTFSWVMQVFQYRVQFGALSGELLRPIHPIHADITDNIAFKIVQMTIMLPAVVILIWLFKPTFNFEILTLLLAIPVIVLAFMIRFLLEWCLALVTFWTTRVAAINQTYFAVSMFFSGRIAPMALMPLWIQDLSQVLPFYYVIAFPVELITGRLSGAEIQHHLLIQGVWLILAGLLIRMLWKKALRNYAAVGG